MIFKRQITSVLLVNLELWQIHETIWATLCNMIKFFCRSGSINVFSGKEVLSSESYTVFSWYIKLFYLERSEDIWFVMIWPSVTGQSINNRLFLKPVLYCDVITKQSVLKCAIDCEGQINICEISVLLTIFCFSKNAEKTYWLKYSIHTCCLIINRERLACGPDHCVLSIIWMDSTFPNIPLSHWLLVFPAVSVLLFSARGII